jgi:hypothetical protein
MDCDLPEYYLRRERSEREAAKNATSAEARRVHQELAGRYASLAKQQSDAAQVWERPPRPRLTIVAVPAR